MSATSILMGYGTILTFTVSPFISVIAASAIASAAGAELHESHPNPCVVWGVDIGPALYRMFVAGWFCLVTFPLGALAFIVFTLYVLFG
jgi:hypothetical protein